jgi:hypothetical protein
MTEPRLPHGIALAWLMFAALIFWAVVLWAWFF